MAEDKKDDEDGEWTEIDISEPEVEIKEEIEIETSYPEDSVVAEKEKAQTGSDEEESEPELEGIETKGAEKRIRQLIKQRKERDEELHTVRTELNQLRYQMVYYLIRRVLIFVLMQTESGKKVKSIQLWEVL